MNHRSVLGLAVIVITRNEEARIERCLAAVAGWASEIVVVDDESTDRTGEISRGFGATVIVHASDGDFGGQRNLGARHARAPWVLSLDADEIATPEFRAEVDDALRAEPPVLAFRISIWNHFLNRRLVHAENVPRIKLYRRDQALFSDGIHEHIDLPDQRVGAIRARLEHYPYESVGTLVLRQNSYTDADAAARPRLSGGRLVLRLTWRPCRRFLVLYFGRRGFRDGVPGFAWAVLSGFYEFLVALKMFEASLTGQRR